MLIKWRHPSSCMVVGPSQSGKTHLVRKIIRESVYDAEIKKVMWCYSAWQKWFAEEKSFNFVKGLPDNVEDVDLLIIDDLMNSLDQNVSKIFTVDSHHKNFSVILITQNLFPRAKVMRDISLNTHYLISFRNNRHMSQAECFARQAFPSLVKFFRSAFIKATALPYSYLFIDVHPQTPDDQRLRDSVFPDSQGINWAYVPES